MDCEYVGRSRRDDRWDERPFSGVRGHLTPGHSVKDGRRNVVPVGVEAVVGGAVAGRLVLGDGLCARRERFQVG